MGTVPARPLAELVGDLADRLGTPRFVAVCCDLLGGASRLEHLEELPWLTGFAFEPGAPTLDQRSYPDYWLRTWGARGLLHVWDDAATPAVLAGIGDEHWRPAEMCLKVATRHEIAGAAEVVVRVAGHDHSRVRSQVMRCLAVCGDTDHVATLSAGLDDPVPAVAAQAERALDRLTERLGLSR